MSEQPTKKQGQTFIEKKPKKGKQYIIAQLKTPKGMLIAAGVALLVIVIFVYVYGEVRPLFNSNEQSEEQVYTDEFLNSDDSDENISYLVGKYGDKYDSSLEKIRSSNPSEWDRSMVDNASATLLYADKIGALNQASLVLSFIEIADNNGVDINDNSYGVNQAIRDSIKQRVEEKAKQTSESAETKNE